jgi:hypothetical protein
MGSVSVPPFRTVSDDCSADNDDDRRASRHLHLHDNRIRITPGCAINLCLRIRRLRVRIPSGAPSCRGHRRRDPSSRISRAHPDVSPAEGDI